MSTIVHVGGVFLAQYSTHQPPFLTPAPCPPTTVTPPSALSEAHYQTQMGTLKTASFTLKLILNLTITVTHMLTVTPTLSLSLYGEEFYYLGSTGVWALPTGICD